MTKRFLTVIVCIFFSGTILGAQVPQTLVLQTAHTPTVGNLFATTLGNHTGFHIPNSPHFRHSFDTKSPRSYSAFYKTNAGKVSLAGFLRFIKNGHRLFKDAKLKKQYQKALIEAIDSHKNYFYKPTEQKLHTLKNAEVEVLLLLQKISLTPEIAEELEAMLSTPPSNIFMKFVGTINRMLILPFRSCIKPDATDPSNLLIYRSTPLLQALGNLLFLATLGIIGFYTAHIGFFILKWGNPVFPVLPATLLITGMILLACVEYQVLTILPYAKSNYKLAPEPFDQKIIIQIKPPEELL